MATERLSLTIAILDDFTDDLNRLLFKLGQVTLAIEEVDGQNIDLDTGKASAKLAALQSQLTGLQTQLAASPGVRAGGGGVGPRGGVAGAAGDTAEALDLTNIRMSDLHNLLAALVPLLLVFIGALPALIGALVALASAAIAAAAGLMALAGFGALGFAMARGGPDNLMEGFSEIIDEISEDFLDAFAPLAERLAPMFERALDGLDRLFQAIANRGDVLVAFTETAADFGAFVQDFLPELLSDMGKMARAFGPFFGELMDVFDFSVLQAFTEFMARMAEETILFLELLVDFTALIGRVSIGFLQVVNAIGLLLQGLFAVLNLLPISEEMWGAFLGTMLALASVMFLTSKLMKLNMALALASLIPRVAMVASEVGLLAAAEFVAMVAARGLTSALITLTGALIGLSLAAGVFGLIAMAVGGLVNHFDLLGTNIDSATQSLREFNRVGNKMSRNPYASPDLAAGSVRGGGSGVGSVNVTIEGNADEEMVREQTGNALYRMERRRRGR